MGRPRQGNVQVCRRVRPIVHQRFTELEVKGYDLAWMVVLAQWIGADPQAQRYLPPEFWAIVKAARSGERDKAQALINTLVVGAEFPWL